MKEIKSLYQKYIVPILIDQEGICFILEDDFDNLSLSLEDKKKLLLYLENLNIGIVKSNFSKEEIEKDGEIVEENRFSFYTKVEYDNLGHIISLDFSKLDNYLENIFLPSNIKVIKIKNNNQISYCETIKLSRILVKGFNNIEIDYIFKYLKEANIIVRGYEPKYDKLYSNYQFIRKTKVNLGKCGYNEKYQQELFEEYKLSNDIKIRNKIVLDNLRLVESISYKYASIFNIDICEINSYGYEGLIMAIDAYNPNLGYRFSTFAMTYIINKILSSIPVFFNMKKGIFFEKFLKAKIYIENEYDSKLEDDLDLVENILDYMLKMGAISIKHYNEYRDKIFMSLPSTLSNLEIDELINDENKLERIEDELFLNSLDDLFNVLSKEEVLIIKASYGLLNGISLTVNEIEDKFNLENVYNKKRCIMRKLRKAILRWGNRFIIPTKYNLDDKISIKKF